MLSACNDGLKNTCKTKFRVSILQTRIANTESNNKEFPNCSMLGNISKLTQIKTNLFQNKTNIINKYRVSTKIS